MSIRQSALKVVTALLKVVCLAIILYLAWFFVICTSVIQNF